MPTHSHSEDNFYDTRNLKISVAERVTETQLKRDSFDKLIEAIKTSSKFKTLIEKIRDEPDANKRRILKQRSLPYFNMGRFKNDKRNNESLLETEFMIFDFDHVTDLNEKRKIMENDPRVFCVFTSPSGDGLKVISKLERKITDPKEFSDTYKFHAAEFGASLGEKEDKTSGVSFPCYVSYDPDIYLNVNAVPLPVENVETESLSKREEVLETVKGGFADGERTENLTSYVGVLIDKGIDQEMALEMIRGWNEGNTPPLSDKKIVDTVESMYKRYSETAKKCDGYYSFESTVIEAGIIGDEFSTSKIGKEKFFIKMGLTENKEKNKYYDYLVKNRHILNLRRMNYLASINLEESYYSFDPKQGEMNIYLAPRAGRFSDNNFIEDYLEKAFKCNKDYIKKWLAVYFHSNYKKLPTLIITGDRGVGKNIFAESLITIFPSLSRVTNELDGHFNPGAEKKLLIVDESESKGKLQYTTLKKLSGQNYLEINEKFVKKYQVQNNLNIIILSNESTPITVDRNELPTDENNNQFLVLRLERSFDQFDPEIKKKLEDRWVHYIRTELKNAYDNLSFIGYRYSIPTPITEEEKKLFEFNATDLDYCVDKVVSDLLEDAVHVTSKFKKWIELGVIPKKSIGDNFRYTYKNVTRHKIITQLNSRKYLVGDGGRKQLFGEREECYKIGERFLKELEIRKAETPHLQLVA